MEIIKLPNKVLTSKSSEVVKVDDHVRDLVRQMREKLLTLDGVGLAAPQVGISLQIAIIGFNPTQEQIKKNPSLKPIPELTLINPAIISKSSQMTVEKEGCLSVGSKEVAVPRHEKIVIEFLDEQSNKRKLKARGYLARIIQHEMDHLRGRLITYYE
jgi:peptide deformylase